MASPAPLNQLEPTISDVEFTIANALEALRNAPLSDAVTSALRFLAPAGYHPVVQLEEDGRKKRSTESASNWNPATGEIVLYFEPNQGITPGPSANAPDPAFARIRKDVELGLRTDPLTLTPDERHAATRSAIASDIAERQTPDEHIRQLCDALAEAEKAGKSFIALKWFRDTELPSRSYEWTSSTPYRQGVLSKAIEVGAVVTGSIPNPKSQHPTTTIRLNRESTYAAHIAPRFQPVTPRGGITASEILLRDRGRS